MEFDQVIAPLTRDAFLSEHWEMSHLHLRGTAGRFSHLFTWDDLNAILEGHQLAPPHIKLSKDGDVITPDQYIHVPAGEGNAPGIDHGRLMAQLADGASLILNSVEELSPRVRALSESFRDTLLARNYVNLYAGWHSQKGFDLHWDVQEVMVLQLSGRKRWQIFAPTQDYPLDRDAPPRPDGPPVLDVVLEDGDILYLPRGWWHVAYPVNEPSLHLSVGIVPTHGLNLLDWIMTRLREQSPMRETLPVLQDAATRKAYVARLRELTVAALDDSVIDEFLHEVQGQIPGRPHFRLPHAPYEQLAQLEDASRIRLASSHALSFTAHGEKSDFLAYGKNYSVPSYVIPALALLSDTKSVSVAELLSALEGSMATASLKQGLALLARAGVVLVEKTK